MEQFESALAVHSGIDPTIRIPIDPKSIQFGRRRVSVMADLPIAGGYRTGNWKKPVGFSHTEV
jgi:hypothetical protein